MQYQIKLSNKADNLTEGAIVEGNIPQTPNSVVYSLTAKADGWYTCYSCGDVVEDNEYYRTGSTGQKEIFLKKDEIWKYGFWSCSECHLLVQQSSISDSRHWHSTGISNVHHKQKRGSSPRFFIQALL